MQEKLMRRTAVLSSFFAVVAMAIMFYYSSVKVIVIAGESTDEKQVSAIVHTEYEDGEALLLKADEVSDYLYISLPDNVTADKISIDNHYMDKVVKIGIMGVEPAYYEQEVPHGRCNEISEAMYYTQDETIYLCFFLKDTYEIDYVYEAGKLSVTFVSPGALYENIAILDAGDAYTNEKRQDGVVKEVVAAVKERLEAQGIKVYNVSTPNGYLLEEKLDAIDKLNGDMYVAIEIGSTEEGKSGMEAYYNDSFFIPFVGNVTLSDAVLREAALATNGKANGLFVDEISDEILRNSQIPSTRLRIGYGKSQEDMDKLYDKEYRQKLANGISAGIVKCFELKAQQDVR